jgi:hypothetical protein
MSGVPKPFSFSQSGPRMQPTCPLMLPIAEEFKGIAPGTGAKPLQLRFALSDGSEIYLPVEETVALKALRDALNEKCKPLFDP